MLNMTLLQPRNALIIGLMALTFSIFANALFDKITVDALDEQPDN